MKSNRSDNTLRLINVVTLCKGRLAPRWVTFFGRVNHLGAEPGTQAYSAWACLGWNEYQTKSGGGSKQAYRVIHQPVSRGLALFADAWL